MKKCEYECTPKTKGKFFGGAFGFCAGATLAGGVVAVSALSGGLPIAAIGIISLIAATVGGAGGAYVSMHLAEDAVEFHTASSEEEASTARIKLASHSLGSATGGIAGGAGLAAIAGVVGTLAGGPPLGVLTGSIGLFAGTTVGGSMGIHLGEAAERCNQKCTDFQEQRARQPLASQEQHPVQRPRSILEEAYAAADTDSAEGSSAPRHE